MVSVLYSAIPPSSSLYSRLQREKALNTLGCFIFADGFGIFDFFEIEPEDINETLENMFEVYPQLFESKLEVDRVVAELRSELTLTRQAFPGIEDRTAILEKTSAEIEQRLVQELSSKQVANAKGIVQKLLEGDRLFAPDLFLAEENESLGLISRKLVREGASLFQQINPKTLFAEDEEWHLDDLENLKDLYLAADENNEVILVGVC